MVVLVDVITLALIAYEKGPASETRVYATEGQLETHGRSTISLIPF